MLTLLQAGLHPPIMSLSFEALQSRLLCPLGPAGCYSRPRSVRGGWLVRKPNDVSACAACLFQPEQSDLQKLRNFISTH
jgi:hypothetical protein